MSSFASEPTDVVFLGTKEVKARVRLSKSEIDRRIKAGRFPSPAARLGHRTIVWTETAIRKWQTEQQIAELIKRLV